MKRIILFLLTNLAVVTLVTIVANIVLSFFGYTIQDALGADSGVFLAIAFLYGMGASLVSLFLSKSMAKMSTKAKTITGNEGEAERWLVDTIADLARRADLKMPEVAIYPGAANAFATGAFRNSALVAVSTDIMGQMSREELRAVLGHEMSHVANGDMVTMSLLQGVINSFVIVFSSAIARVFCSALSSRDSSSRRSRGDNGLYYLVYQVLQMVLGVLGSLITMGFSRHREYAADAGSAKLLGSPSPMIAALRRLGNLQPGALPNSLKAFGISSGKKSIAASLFATHPSLGDRIAALERLKNTI